MALDRVLSGNGHEVILDDIRSGIVSKQEGWSIEGNAVR